MAAAHHGQMPTRTRAEAGYISDDDAVPANNPTDTTSLLAERLQAWKHMCGYLENYISEVAKDQKSQAKDQDKVLKTLSHPLKESHHFDQSTGGVAGLFENLRANTQAQANLHGETSKNLTGSVLPILERLHSEIKSKAKELDKGAGKGSKAVESARASSQKHIELLGQHTAGVDAAGSRTTAQNDPYLLRKQVAHRLNKQLLEENNNRADLIAVQNSFASFEAHVLQTVQAAMNQFNQYMSGQADRQKAMYGDVAGNAARIPADFEWNGFVNRNSDKLISPNAPKRTIDTVSYPNQDHHSTKALIEGTLDRKGKGLGALGGYSSGFYAVTPAGYFHEFKDNDDYRHDPSPVNSFYLPDCIIGALDGVKFTIKGKDTSGGKISQKMSSHSEYSFKAHSAQDAQQWYNVLSSRINATTVSTPSSPVDAHKVAPINTQAGAMPADQSQAYTSPQQGVGAQHQGVVSHETPTSATGSVPHQYEYAQAGAGSVPQGTTSAHAPQSALSGTQPASMIPEEKKY